MKPTQTQYPWRATARTVFQALVALAVVLPVAVNAAGINPDKWPWVAGVLLVAGAVTRVMAVPMVNDWIARFLPFLAPEPKSVADGE